MEHHRQDRPARPRRRADPRWPHGGAALLMSLSLSCATAQSSLPGSDAPVRDVAVAALGSQAPGAMPASVAPAAAAPAAALDAAGSAGIGTIAGLGANEPASTRSPLALKASVAALRARLQPWRASGSTGASEGTALRTGPNIQVIELPREGAPIGPPRRAHHAVSVGMDGPKQMLRGLGLDATDCAARFRMPSKLNRKSDGSTSIDISAQLGMACKF